MQGSSRSAGTQGWTFLSNHTHVLLCLSLEASARLRDVAAWVGITERAVQKIVADLEAAGFLERVREGRRNHYVLHPEQPLRHPLERNTTVGELLEALRLHAPSLDGRAPNDETPPVPRPDV